jgi:ribosomal protein S18 acetylase RimI-like enzyme
MNITRASPDQASEVARLFDLYRQFYECEPDLKLAESFIRERLEKGESTIFVAQDHGELVGFVQLYGSFCSVEAVKIYILYDLFVDPGVRHSGVGEQLMNRATQFAREQGAARIDLLTAYSNKAGQHLYEKLGYQKTLEDFHAYSLTL